MNNLPSSAPMLDAALLRFVPLHHELSIARIDEEAGNLQSETLRRWFIILAGKPEHETALTLQATGRDDDNQWLPLGSILLSARGALSRWVMSHR